VVRLAVSDDAVREAFVRVAYYASASTRTRQLATADSAPVAGAGRASVAIALEPPPLAVAFRVRVLARLADPAGRSVRTRRPQPCAGRGAPSGPLARSSPGSSNRAE